MLKGECRSEYRHQYRHMYRDYRGYYKDPLPHSPPREWNDVRNEVVWRIEGSRTNIDPRIQGALRFGKSRIWVFSVR